MAATCIICENYLSGENRISLSCNCIWCQEGLNHRFRSALANQASFPPRCCRYFDTIDFSTVQSYLDDDVLHRWNEVSEEFSTKNPTYCANVKCAKFIPPARVKEHQDNLVACL